MRRINREGSVVGVSVMSHGADPTGVSNSKQAFLDAIATGEHVYVPEGTYLITGSGTAGASQLVLSDGQNLYGDGRKSIIYLTGNYRCVTIGAHSLVRDLKFRGHGKATSGSFQTGIFCSGKLYWEIRDCFFENFSGAAQQNGGGAIYATVLNSANSEGGKITNPWFDNNNGGLVFGSRGEYVTVSNIQGTNNTTALCIGAGNIIVNGGHLGKNTTAIKIIDGTNDGHGIITGIEANHNTTNVDVSGIENGFTFNACNFYSGNINITNSPGVKFGLCDLLIGTLTITSSANTLISSCRFPKGATTGAMTLVGAPVEANNLDF